MSRAHRLLALGLIVSSGLGCLVEALMAFQALTLGLFDGALVAGEFAGTLALICFINVSLAKVLVAQQRGLEARLPWPRNGRGPA